MKLAFTLAYIGTIS